VKKNMDLETKMIATQKNAPSMVSGVSGVSVVKHVVEEGRKELAQIQHLHMEELTVKLKVMDLQMKTIATQKNALSMVSGVSGVIVVKHVVEDRRQELAQIQRLHMEGLIVKKNMGHLEIKMIATLKNAPVATIKWDAQESCGEKCFQESKCLL